MRLLLLPLLLALGAQEASSATAPIGFDPETVALHKLAGEDFVPNQRSRARVPVLVTVSPDGRVVNARAIVEGGRRVENAAPALAAARRWRFRPFQYRGRPVAARGRIEIAYVPPATAPNPDVAFPSIDYATLRIELTRRPIGTGSGYSLSIDGEGNVTFTSERRAFDRWTSSHRGAIYLPGVLFPGTHRWRIGRSELDVLIGRFRDARFFSLRPDYTFGISHGTRNIMVFETSGHRYTVRDYHGRAAGMPLLASELPDAIDAAVGANSWVRGDAGTTPALRAEGFDFQSADAVALAGMAMGSIEDTDRLIVDLIEAGLPLDRPHPLEGDPPGPPLALGAQLLLSAVDRGRPLTFAALVERGWAARVSRDLLSAVFVTGRAICDPALARAVIAAGADPMARTRDEGPWRPAGATALMLLLDHGPCWDAPVPLAELTRSLVTLGVDVNAIDAAGQTALFGVERADLVDLLLALGARADVRDRAGRSPLFYAESERVLLTLLDAGADPRGRDDGDNEGLTLRQIARRQQMPTLLARLRAWRPVRR